MAKVNISIDDRLLERVDELADSLYMSRSGLISTATTQWVNQNEMMSAINSMAVSMRKIADSGVVDEDTMNELRDFERLSKLFTGK